MFLIIAGFSLLLLPLGLASRSVNKWKSTYIITMMVFGAFTLVLFGLWEKFYASVPLFPWKYLKDRTILGSVLLAAAISLTNS